MIVIMKKGKRLETKLKAKLMSIQYTYCVMYAI